MSQGGSRRFPEAGESMRLQTRPRFKSLNQLELTPTDLNLLSTALRTEFPTIRFLRSDYSEHWIERRFADRVVEGRNEIISEIMRPPHDDPMPYCDSLQAVPRGRIEVWLEPAGWKPKWSAKPYRRNEYVLLNEPSLHFILLRSDYVIVGPEGMRGGYREPPSRLGEDEVCWLCGGHIYGPYFADDLEQQNFLKAVWRILRRVTTQDFVFVDPATLEARFIVNRGPLRAGLDAARWSLDDRRHLIGSQLVYRATDDFRPGSRRRR